MIHNIMALVNLFHWKLSLRKSFSNFFEGACTFLTGGLTITSSKVSSAFTVWKFSWRMAIFFSLSQPDGLTEQRKGYKPNTSSPHSPGTYIHIKAGLHEDSISFHHLCRAEEGKTVESVDQIFVQDVQVFHLLHWCVKQRRSVWHGCQGYFQNRHHSDKEKKHQ